jgi:uncharacterized protein YkwD
MNILSNGYRFEAEALTLSGYRSESSSNSDAFSGKFIGAKQFNGATGKAYGKFAGEPGTYQVEVGYYDENDGQSLAQVTVAGKTTGFRFNNDLNSLDPVNPPPAPSGGNTGVNPPPPPSGGNTGVDPSPPPSGGDTGLDAFEAEVVRLVNEFRAQNGKTKLNVNAALSQAAEEHSEDMAFNDFFSHTGSDGSQVGARVSEEGYDGRSVGENIAAGQSTPQKVFNAWKASPGHNANMLGSWEDIGVGYEYLDNDTGSVNYHHYWTANFGLA